MSELEDFLRDHEYFTKREENHVFVYQNKTLLQKIMPLALHDFMHDEVAKITINDSQKNSYIAAETYTPLERILILEALSEFTKGKSIILTEVSLKKKNNAA